MWEGEDDLGWRSICSVSAQEKRGFEPVPSPQTCSASKACEDAGHTGLPPSHTIVLGSLNGQLDFPSEETLVKRSIPWNSLEHVAFDLAFQFYMSLFLF